MGMKRERNPGLDLGNEFDTLTMNHAEPLYADWEAGTGNMIPAHVTLLLRASEKEKKNEKNESSASIFLILITHPASLVAVQLIFR